LLNEFEVGLDAFEVTLSNPDVEYILSLSREQLEGLSIEDCGIYEVILSRHAYYLQKTSNRLGNRLRWAKHNLDVIIGKEAANMGDKWTKFEERSLMVKTQNSYAKALDKIILTEGAKVEELQFLSGKVISISKALASLQQAKRNNHG
jgi:hypothetical protein